MMKFYQVGRFLKRHLPEFLAIGASVGVVVTAITSGSAAIKALELKEEAEEIHGSELTRRESIVAQAPAYILPAVSAALTVGFIFGCHFLNRKQQASIAAAALTLEKTFAAYRKKAIENFGNEVTEAVQVALAEESYDQNDNMPTPTDGNILCYHPEVDQWVCCSPKSISEGKYEFNQRLSYFGAISLADYCDIFGLEVKPGYDSVGWSCEFIANNADYFWVDFDEDEVETDAHGPYTIVEPEFGSMIDYENWIYGDKVIWFREGNAA